MTRINLLPWREELREERKKRFMVILVAVLLVAGLVLFMASQYFDMAIENQRARNDFIRAENAALDVRIKEISELRQRRQELIERMKIIQDLQGNRPIVSRIFDQIVRALPDGVYFTSMKLVGKRLAIEGEAESNSLVSTLMRNQDASEWLTSPNLTEVKAVNTDGQGTEQASRFKLTVEQTKPQISADGQGARP